MSLQPGDQLGPYEILSLVGTGGMGEVYKALDSRLDRTVAIKVLPPSRTQDLTARQRLAREARVIAGLSHPHICPLFDVGQQNGADFLVMEFLEGETLASRLARGRLPLDQALRYGIEMAGALAAAHSAGIVHRDLKPSNVILTKSGAKLLDFGIAKPRPELAAAQSDRDDQAADLAAMAPSPARCNTWRPSSSKGTRPISGATSSRSAPCSTRWSRATAPSRRPPRRASSRRSSSRSLPRWPPHGVTAPPGLDYLIRTCLTKAPELRWQSAQDVVLGLQRVFDERLTEATTTRAGTPPRFWWYGLAAALLAVLATAIAVVVWPHRAERAQQRARFDISLPERLGFDWPDWPVVSPDGQRLAFSARSEGRRQLWVRSVDGAVTPLADTEGSSFAFWSPDSRAIAFVAGGRLKKVDVGGGPVTVLSDAYSVSRGAWSPQGTILFVPRPNGPIHAVADTGGQSRPVTTLDTNRGETSHRVFHFLPDGRHFLYGTSGQRPGIYAASIDGGPSRDVLAAVSAATFAPPNYLLFNRQQTLMAQRFDSSTLERARIRRCRLPRRSPAAPSRSPTRARSSIARAAAAAASSRG